MTTHTSTVFLSLTRTAGANPFNPSPQQVSAALSPLAVQFLRATFLYNVLNTTLYTKDVPQGETLYPTLLASPYYNGSTPTMTAPTRVHKEENGNVTIHFDAVMNGGEGTYEAHVCID